MEYMFIRNVTAQPAPLKTAAASMGCRLLAEHSEQPFTSIRYHVQSSRQPHLQMRRLRLRKDHWRQCPESYSKKLQGQYSNLGLLPLTSSSLSTTPVCLFETLPSWPLIFENMSSKPQTEWPILMLKLRIIPRF